MSRATLLPATDLDRLRRRIRALTENRPAVYRMMSATGRVLYVGKARRLRTRLLTYFRAEHPDKQARILNAASDIRWDYVPSEFAALLGEVQRILRAAIDSQGTTFRDYRTGTGQPGNFQLELAVYGREGEPCRTCGTRLAHTHDIDARITVFCHRCQR